MLRTALAGILAAPLFAAPVSPSGADFPAGYWEREAMSYGRTATSYNVSLAAAAPAKLRVQAEKMFRAADGRLTSFSDQSNYPQPAVPEHAGAARARPVYSLGYQLPAEKAAELAQELIGLGRLVSYMTNVPYGAQQIREIDEKIEWVEREQREAAKSLKAMPVSRALLAAKLKSLRAAQDSIKASAGLATISLQIMKEAEEPGR
jgi:hypothetical protein